MYPAVVLMCFVSAAVLPASLALMVHISLPHNRAGSFIPISFKVSCGLKYIVNNAFYIQIFIEFFINAYFFFVRYQIS